MCTTIIVGRDRSATGAVLLAHSEELGRNSAHLVAVSPAFRREDAPEQALHSGGTLPRPDRCARYLATKIFDKGHYPGEHTSGVNEHGVAVANNMAQMRGIPEASAYDVVPGGLIWSEFMQAVLESATTAREGVELVGRLCSERGLSCDSGTMLAVVDPTDAWWVELARDGQWLAHRIEPDEVSIRANCFRLGPLNLEDASSVLASPSLLTFAQSQGWAAAGSMDFAAVYGDSSNQTDDRNHCRHDLLEARFKALPKVGTRDLLAALRDVYEGTPRYQTRPDGSPFRTDVRTIARMNTEASTVAELRPELPTGMGHRLWCSLSTSLTGTYLPFHLGIQAVEPHYALATPGYDPRSAYWLFTELAKLADYGYPRCIERIRETWTTFESATFEALEQIEREVTNLPQAEAIAALEAFDHQRAAAAVDTLKELLVAVKTRVFYEAF